MFRRLSIRKIGKVGMKYNPDVHHRRSIRLKEYDYSQAGAYFITICTRNKELYFERYSKLKQIVNQQWQKILENYANIQLDEFVIMPNHIHGIIFVGATLAVAQKNRAGAKPAPTIAQNNRAGSRPAPTIGEIIGTFKSLCVYDLLKYIKKTRLMRSVNSGNEIIMKKLSVTNMN